MNNLTYTSLADTIRGRNPLWNEYISSSKYLSAEKILVRVIAIVFIVNTLIGLFFIKKYFIDTINTPVALASIKTPLVYNFTEDPPSPSLEALLNDLEGENLDGVARRKIVRPLYEVDGRIVTLNKDSMEVFEYKDNKAAMEKFAEVSDAYTHSAWPKVYKDQIHLYVKNNLGIYYLGHDEKIIEALTKLTNSNFPVNDLF